MAKAPSIRDRQVMVRAYMTDENFGYDHWRATQFLSPDRSLPAVLLIFSDDAERQDWLNRTDRRRSE